MLSQEITKLESLDKVAQLFSNLLNAAEPDAEKIGEVMLSLHKTSRLALLPMPAKTKKSLKVVKDLNDKLSEGAMGADNTLHELINKEISRIERQINAIR